MSNKVVALFGLAGIGAICGTAIFSKKMTEDAHAKEKELKYQTDLEIAQIKKSYPPEYWNAKAAEASAKADVEKARLESKERLELDLREREDIEKAYKRAFEKDAPAEYWEQKRIEETEKTKRQEMEIEDARRKRIEEQERYIARRNAEAFEKSAKSIERAVRSSCNYDI